MSTIAKCNRTMVCKCPECMEALVHSKSKRRSGAKKTRLETAITAFSKLSESEREDFLKAIGKLPVQKDILK